MDSLPLRHLFSRALRASLASSLVLASCVGPDLTGYYTPVCEGYSFAVSGLSPAVPVDFVQLRYISTKPTEGSSTEGVLSSSGTACATASDKAACELALSNLSSRSGFSSVCDDTVERCSARYLATTRGDEVVAHTSLEALKGFLGPIDTAQEAALIAFASHHDLSCQDMPRHSVRSKEEGGFTVIGNIRNSFAYDHGCGEVIQFVLDVSVSGDEKELRRYVLEPVPERCQAAAGPQDSEPGVASF